MMIVLIGLTSIFLTLNFYKCKWLRFVFVCLGVSGLISLSLFMLNGSFCALGLFGSIGLVLTLHCLVLRQVKDDLNEGCRPLPPPPCPPPCPPYNPCDQCDPCDPCEPYPPPYNPCEPCNKYDTKTQKLDYIKNNSGCCVEKRSCFNETVKSNEVKFIESSVKTPCGSKYNKYYHKKSYYKNKCENKYCKKCHYKNTESSKCKTKSPCGRNSEIFNDMFMN